MADEEIESAGEERTDAEAAPQLTGIAAGAKVEHLPLEKLADDETFMFRANLRVGDLKASIQADGQQLPIVVRKTGKTRGMRYQVISGFRRLKAVKALGWTTIAAIVREDLDDDEAAFRASVLENTARKTYSDIDRAIAIRRYRDAGHKAADVAVMMGLSDRRRKMIESLLNMPKVVQDAVDDASHPLTTKHAIVLARLKSKHPKLDWKQWVRAVKKGELTANQMVRAINKALGAEGAPKAGFTTLFQERGTDFKNGEVWFAPTRVKVGEMTGDEKAALKAELEKVLRALEG